ncbi:uncharacterized protein [Prorops nasuta]|uniref:uncharacterized protein n=1 Tax=Prorops nasuta TaxID=863751 RepID=UPI0034CE1CB4
MTIQVVLISSKGYEVSARALLDQGSEVSFISESLVQSLNLMRHRVNIPVIGIGASKNATARYSVTVCLQSSDNKDFKIDFLALVLTRLCTRLPSSTLSPFDLTLFTKYRWADPRFYESREIDLILGVDIYASILQQGFCPLVGCNIIAQNTALGWIFSGSVNKRNYSDVTDCVRIPRIAAHNSIGGEDLSEILKLFWQIEEVPESKFKLSPQDEFCEKQFATTHLRNSRGRYIVRLPFKAEPPLIASQTRGLAFNSFQALRRKFGRDPELAREYRDFMQNYLTLGHMELVPEEELNVDRAWYLPHHAVIQNGPFKRKIRVVFDASRRIAVHGSLNDFLLAGPPLQSDLSLILLGWRSHRYVFTTDIVKMFRQILVENSDKDFQRILWAPDQNMPPRDYRLVTVTYGTASAPYLAMKTLRQLAIDEGHRYPYGAQCLLEQSYVDDIFSGGDDLSDAILKRDQLVAILQTAGIDLDKWAANTSELLPSGNLTDYDSNVDKLIIPDQAVKTLGLIWHPSTDRFSFNVQIDTVWNQDTSKRVVLSNLARLFDPLGWLAPVVVRAKILLQDIWILKLDWDSPLPTDVLLRWKNYCQNLQHVPEVSVKRWLGGVSISKGELHGFSDASMRAYAAVIYLRTIDNDGNYQISLLIAKSKVAPVKTVSIPNLELCGAVLLVKLFKHVLRLDLFKNLPVMAWSDSRDVLAWIRKHPAHWKVFVANRVSYIQTELPSAVSKYVPTRDNPADLATRGIDPIVLKDSQIWWHGPKWLKFSNQHWPEQPISVKPPQTCVNALPIQQYTDEAPILKRFSSLTKLFRVVALCYRFVDNCRRQKSGSPKAYGSPTCKELDEARLSTIRLVQSSTFSKELTLLKEKRLLPRSSVLQKLNPFLDKHGIICVGGRLNHSALPFPEKHPPILPKDSALSQLFVQQSHRLALHGGPTLTLSLLVQQVWVVGAIRLVKRHVRACVKCFRARPRRQLQQMGNLPAARVTPSRPFTVTGLDYAGPFSLRFAKGRGQRSYKGYIALFVCFATKAIHLEAVGDLTTQAFLAALRRFTSRRGVCQKIYSDNGTNFQGAANELKLMFKASSEFYSQVSSELAIAGIDWNFIPPHSPHFGGLWEAGVKSTKHHLIRVIGEHILTFEEFATVLAEIEACLNSRPLYPMSGDMDDLTVLTPSHFLIGSSSGLIPDVPISDVPENRLSRYQLLSRLQQHFWKKWSREYLHHLQERNKWKGPTTNFRVGQLVVINDERLPPSKWSLGRIIEVHPGDDGLVRVATVKTSTSTLKRPIVRLSPLPQEDDDPSRRVAIP